MTVTQFDHGYWYATELKHFAKGLGIPSASKLRKDKLEHAIRVFLRTGAIALRSKRKSSAPREGDVERGLHLDLLVVGYRNDAETKQFLEQEARKLVPGLKRRSGARYRLNRWREAQIHGHSQDVFCLGESAVTEVAESRQTGFMRVARGPVRHSTTRTTTESARPTSEATTCPKARRLP
jgi:hypothetical protein